MKAFRSFASDNNAGVHPEILRSLETVNSGHMLAYGEDAITARAAKKFETLFGPDIEVFFVFNGTAANVLALSAVTKPWQSVICSDQAHAYWDECGAPERFLGSKLLAIPTPNGKFGPKDIEPLLWTLGDQHRSQPKTISITQTTETGSLWTVDEIKELAGFAKSKDFYLHMDGARISNAAAALGIPVREFTRDAGVDVMSFGGTKIGLLCGEAVVFFNKELAKDFLYIRKQGMQLASKMRFIATQFEALLENDLWLRNARHSNDMAAKLENLVRDIPGVVVPRPAEANAVFAILPRTIIDRLRERYDFHIWNEPTGEVRWMTSFDTTEEDVRSFAAFIQETLRKT